MVARDAVRYIDAAIRSARAQTFTDFELVIVDDGSVDGTRDIVRSHAADDPRIRLLDGPEAGLAAVRNASLAAARGRYAAILDSDDLVHPRHVELLVAAAERTGAAVVAANMIEFDADGPTLRPVLVVPGNRDRARSVTMTEYIRSNRLYTPGAKLGYFKPLIDLAFLREHDLGYDPRVRIGEDYDLVVRAMACGAGFLYLSRPTYFYRKHKDSISHRLGSSDILRMLTVADAGGGPGASDAVRAALAERRASLDRALAHARVFEALKALKPIAALRAFVGAHDIQPLVRDSIRASGTRRLARLGHMVGRRGARTRGETPKALVIGPKPAPDDAMSGLLAWLAADGWSIARRPVPRRGAEATLAAGLPPADLILLASDAAIEAVAYALSPDAELIREGDLADWLDGAPGPALATRIARARERQR